MIFSQNVKDNIRDEVLSMWGCRATQQYQKYLSLPTIIGRSRKKALSEIKAKLWQRLQT